jgi:hypothetical protein
LEELGKEVRQEYSSFTEEFCLVRKELYSAKEEFGLAELLS